MSNVTRIGKGARFLVLSGEWRGREGTITGGVERCHDLWWLDLGEGATMLFEQSDADGPGFKRLADAPAEVDPLFAEIESCDIDASRVGGAGGAIDEILNIVDDIDEVESEEDCLAARRAALVEIAALALAGIRAIDRG